MEGRNEDCIAPRKYKSKLKQGSGLGTLDEFVERLQPWLLSGGFRGRENHWTMKSVRHWAHQATTQGLKLHSPGSETSATAMLQMAIFLLCCLPVVQACPGQATVDPDADRGWFLVVSLAMMSFLRGPMRRLAGLLMGASCVIGLFAQNDPSVPVEFGWM